MKVIAKSRIVEGGALHLPGEVFEVEEERFKSLGDVVEEAPEETEIVEPETDPEGPDENPDPRKLTLVDKLKLKLGFSAGKVDLDISNLSEISIDDIQFLTMDQLNDIFASVEGLDLNPAKMKKGEMIDAILTYIEQFRENASKENDTE